MESYKIVDGKKYKRGYTTGSSATAASKAAFVMLLLNKKIDNIIIDTPKGISLKIDVENQFIDKNNNLAYCSVKKDSGDDIDATHGMSIYSKIEILDKDFKADLICEKISPYIEVTCGVGIGIVTKKGLSVEINRPAINPVPLKTICQEIEKTIEDLDVDLNKLLNLGQKDEKKIMVTIYAPEGEEIAKNTFNSNLGIIGGISIIGTSGIVEPMSDEGWQKALSLELSQKKEYGYDDIYLVPGNIGYDNLVNNYGINENKIVKMSNFIGYMLMECKRLNFNKIVIAGHIGKLIKLSAGIMNSHSRVADGRKEIMISNLALLGAPIELLKEIDNCITTDAMIDFIEKYNFEEVFDVIACKAAKRAKKHMRDEKIDLEVMIFSMEGALLGKSFKGE